MALIQNRVAFGDVSNVENVPPVADSKKAKVTLLYCMQLTLNSTLSIFQNAVSQQKTLTVDNEENVLSVQKVTKLIC